MTDYVTGLQNPQSGDYLYVLQNNVQVGVGSYFISQIDLTTASATLPDPWVTLPLQRQ